MAVTNDTIIQKMQKELAQAKQLTGDERAMKKHIANIHLLCELLLEEESVPGAGSDFTAEEMKAMIGTTTFPTPRETTGKVLEEDGANGDSIFDF
ncbi:hypothetical protein FH966_03290 [Lentibacillus cibarius]|uniref:YwdI family protein n=1 Tax=Lentibacillus cibarius TaxID=2583219 RepID=A0A549YG03_9BACI|nr:YwdI family protein [Lentibacillus cibarius]TRM10822.1 hypothetical protein FH966_03290 [Lentibacillus cibarius]